MGHASRTNCCVFLCCYNLISNIIQSDKIGCHHVDVWFFLNADSAKQMVLSGKPV